MPTVTAAEPARASVVLEVFNSGWVNGPKPIVLPGSGWGHFRMPALFALIHHPQRGNLLYDTGYSTRFYEATRRFPYRIMRYLTPAEIEEQDNADRQLARAGVDAEQVQAIILGHGHVDHVPGVVYFPRARVIVDRREWEAMQGPAGRVFRKAYLKSLYRDLPNPIDGVDFERDGRPLGPFERTIDLYGDGSLVLVSLPGHSAGHMGLLVRATRGNFFLIGDAAWVEGNYLDLRPQARIVGAIWSSRADLMDSMRRIRDFARDNPDTIIIPSHCPASWQRLQEMGVAGGNRSGE